MGWLQTGDQLLHLFKEGRFGSWGKEKSEKGFPTARKEGEDYRHNQLSRT